MTRHEEFRRKVWLDTFLTLAANPSTRCDLCIEWAADALKHFDKRFEEVDEENHL